MRYRPFARSGMALSALSLALDGDQGLGADQWRDRVHCAFEEGVNAFVFVAPSHDLLTGFAEGAQAGRRHLLFGGLGVGANADAKMLQDWADNVIATARLEELNLVTLEAGDQADGESLSKPLLAAMRRMQDAGRVQKLGVAGAGEIIAEPIRSGAFDAVATPFNILSGWRERHLIRTAVERGMSVIGCDPSPGDVSALIEGADEASKPGWFKQSSPLAGVGTYRFLRLTTGWSPEQLCLGYAFTEPALATVQVRVADREHLTTLAEVAERDLPAAISAQIEMARFSAERASGVERRSAMRRSA